jgi:fluoroacetyl-CoA thioesterase
VSDTTTGRDQLEEGLTSEYSREVTSEMSARHLGSGDVGVLSTPSMIALMEGTSLRCVQPYLKSGETTVGYIVNIRHLAPTAIGRTVRVRAELVGIDGRKLRFKVEAFEGEKKIGDGEHVRVVVDSAAFVKGEQS